MMAAVMAATKMIERTLIFLIRAYQHTFGMLMPRVCRYEPTCSQYSIDAIREHGIFRGLGLSAWRIVRCNPWCQGGHDPVPVRHEVKGIWGCGYGKKNGDKGIRGYGDEGMKYDFNAPNDLNHPNAINEHNDLNVFYHRNLYSYHRNLSAEGRS
jgi:putative membrane protein insertion efficiency factor